MLGLFNFELKLNAIILYESYRIFSNHIPPIGTHWIKYVNSCIPGEKFKLGDRTVKLGT